MAERWYTLAMKRALLGLLLAGCGGLEYEPSQLSQMDVVGVWTEVFRSDNPPELFPVASELMHHQDTGVAYLTPWVGHEEMAHALTHVWIRRGSLKLSEQQQADAPGSLLGDPEHIQPVWAANNPGEHVLERAAVMWLRANPTR